MMSQTTSEQHEYPTENTRNRNKDFVSGMKGILNNPSFDVGMAEMLGPVESDDLSRFEGEGGSQAPERTAEWIDVPLEHSLQLRDHRNRPS
jgi:hypothetical protein